MSAPAVYVAGVGQIPVGEHWSFSLRDLAVDAVCRCLDDAAPAPVERIGAIVVANMASAGLARQENLGALVADAVGMSGVEAYKVEAACASGGAALRCGMALVEAGAFESVLVVGVEKMTDSLPDHVNSELALAADADGEALHGLTFTALNALLTSRYLERYGIGPDDLSLFPLHAHHQARRNPNAMFRGGLTWEKHQASALVASPLRTFDCPPICDGAAAVLLTVDSLAAGRPTVRLAACAGATDTLLLAAREDPLWLRAAADSAHRALQRAGRRMDEVSLFELHDAFPVMAALSLEAVGFAEPGQALTYARDGTITQNGKLPIQTMGGLKARGHPVGATGVYQAVEAVLQLRGEAGGCQVPGAKVALTQNLGGTGASAFTAVFERCDRGIY